MKHVQPKTGDKNLNIPRQAELPAEPSAVPSADVENVLEHISSPYRWELLEVPCEKTESGNIRKSAQVKTRNL
jgi:hypothetical protein